jgi:glycosyltransferase involved in cell wall biosynthesis
LEIDGAAFVILFVGRLVEIKRVDRFVEAINEMGNEFPSVLALIVGDGPEYDRVLPLIENAARFRFVGWQEDLGPYYAAADMVCLTSDNEGMPIALIEAALGGLPAVTTDAGSAREVVKHQETGLVVPIDNFPKLLEAIRIMITDAPLRDGLGFRAKEFAEHAFSGARLARDHAEIYEMLVTRRS